MKSSGSSSRPGDSKRGAGDRPSRTGAEPAPSLARRSQPALARKWKLLLAALVYALWLLALALLAWSGR